MAGRQEFEAVVAQAPKKSLVVLPSSITTALPASGSETTYYYAPAGFIATVRNLYITFYSPAGATAGDNRAYISQAGQPGDFIFIQASFNVDIQFNYGSIQSQTINILPTDPPSQGNVMRSITFDNVLGLSIQYQNNTNVVSNANRTQVLTFIKEQVTA